MPAPIARPTASHSARPVAETEAAIEQASDERAILILKHRQQWAVIDRFRAESIRRALMSLETEKSDEVMLLRRDADWLLGYYKRQAESILDAQEGQRRAYGFDYRQQQEESEEDEAISERRRAILRSLEALRAAEAHHAVGGGGRCDGAGAQRGGYWVGSPSILHDGEQFWMSYRRRRPPSMEAEQDWRCAVAARTVFASRMFGTSTKMS